MKRSGFTLAEVLITLGIVGVVCAMTFPTLINEANKTNHQPKKVETIQTVNTSDGTFH